MKKPYAKPLVYAEAFELVEHVAGNCLVNDGFVGALHRSTITCGYKDDNVTLFTKDVFDCKAAVTKFNFAEIYEMPTTADGAASALSQMNMQCYNSFLATGNLFAS